jgi:putative tryptophan/tyrosine transport system substrate-binding protein
MTRLAVALLALALLAAPLAAEAQQAGRVYRIGALTAASRAQNPSYIKAFEDSLQQHGYVPGQNLSIEYRFAEGQPERLPELATELVRLNVDVIVAVGTTAARAASTATTTIPIVTSLVGDPIAAGLVSSLARPGGNVTGLSLFAPEVYAKGLELLKAVVPRIVRVALLEDSSNPGHALTQSHVGPVAKALGLSVKRIGVVTARDVDAAFAAVISERADAVLVYLALAPLDCGRQVVRDEVLRDPLRKPRHVGVDVDDNACGGRVLCQ